MWVFRAERPAKVYFEIYFGAGMRVGFFQYSDFKRNGNSIRKWKTNNIKAHKYTPNQRHWGHQV